MPAGTTAGNADTESCKSQRTIFGHDMLAEPGPSVPLVFRDNLITTSLQFKLRIEQGGQRPKERSILVRGDIQNWEE